MTALANTRQHINRRIHHLRSFFLGCIILAVCVGSSSLTAQEVELQRDIPVTALSGAQDSIKRYSYSVPNGATNVSIKTSGGTGDVDMYVKFGAAPTFVDNDCTPQLEGNTESCTFQTSEAGTYHIMLDGYYAYSNLTIVATHTPNTVDEPIKDIPNKVSESVSAEKKAVTPEKNTTITEAIDDDSKNAGLAKYAELYAKVSTSPPLADCGCDPWKEEENGILE